MGARHIVITGATRGLGAALAAELLTAGHRVSGCGRSADAASSRTSSPDFDLARVDVSRFAEVEAWARRIIDERGAPDLLVNNAALINANASLWEVPPAEFAALVDVNLSGSFNVTRAFLPAMIARGRGVVVNLSSGWGRSTAPEVAPYCASKWGIEGLTRALAQELPRGLAAVALNPGVIDTAMLRSCFGGGAGAYEKPDQWARRAAPFLLELSAAQNGQSLSVP
jgi:NAD(P)-dependent dehydrogenase (short-subunit alcohol dehydrogenase family)